MPLPIYSDPQTFAVGDTTGVAAKLNYLVQDAEHAKYGQDRLVTLGGATAAGIGLLLVQDTTGADTVKATTAAGEAGPHWVAMTAATVGNTLWARPNGIVDLQVTGTVTVGARLYASSTAGKATATATGTEWVGIALTADSGGYVVAVLRGPAVAVMAAGLAVGGGQVIESGGVGEAVVFALESFDTDLLHFTSAANLTGTVAKTSASAGLVGTGTSFTTELSVGQLLDVPGTAIERRVVTAITDNTNLTVSSNYSNSASGQTATRGNTGLVCRVPGLYLATGHVQYATPGTTGDRYSAVLSTNGQPATGAASPHAAEIGAQKAGTFPSLFVAGLRNLALWDWVELYTYQDSGSDQTLQSAHLDMVRLGG